MAGRPTMGANLSAAPQTICNTVPKVDSLCTMERLTAHWPEPPGRITCLEAIELPPALGLKPRFCIGGSWPLLLPGNRPASEVQDMGSSRFCISDLVWTDRKSVV